TLVKEGVEYDYLIEIADDFPKQENNVRIKIIEERPKIRKVRTRYDPEIEMFGEQGATMDIVMGYDVEGLKGNLRSFLSLLSFPFLLAFWVWAITLIPTDGISKNAEYILVSFFVPLLLVSLYMVGKFYFHMLMELFADYLKSRDLMKELEKDGFRKE
ncbi:MAG: hypothetical protein HQ490_05195, partial [Lutibacter sp.]|nr:hypothetical protein [Lutibacter sp.]